MRASALALPLLLASLLVPAGAAVVGGACSDSSETTAAGFAWAPGCLRIVSGDVVVFRNADAAPHNARSGLDDAPALRLLAPACFQTANFGQGGSAAVRFVHDSGGVTASVRAPDGSWGPARDCALAEDPLTLGSTEASIPFECGIHPSMTGKIVVRSLG